MRVTKTGATPWYREPWPWLLMAGPVTVIIAGGFTAWLAVTSSDGLVADDYYKQGLAINQTLERDVLATQRGYRAEVRFDDESRSVAVRMATAAGGILPETLMLRVVHPTRAGQDRLVLLRRGSAGDYVGVGAVLSNGRWLLVLEDAQATWRLMGSVVFPSGADVALDVANINY